MEARFRQKINDFENKTKYYFLDSDVFIRINYFSFYIFTFKTFDFGGFNEIFRNTMENDNILVLISGKF